MSDEVPVVGGPLDGDAIPTDKIMGGLRAGAIVFVMSTREWRGRYEVERPGGSWQLVWVDEKDSAEIAEGIGLGPEAAPERPSWHTHESGVHHEGTYAECPDRKEWPEGDPAVDVTISLPAASAAASAPPMSVDEP